MDIKEVEKAVNIQENWFVLLIGLCLVYGIIMSFPEAFLLLFLLILFLFIIWLLGGGFKWIKTKLSK